MIINCMDKSLYNFWSHPKFPLCFLSKHKAIWKGFWNIRQEGEVQEGKSPSSLLFQAISPSSLFGTSPSQTQLLLRARGWGLPLATMSTPSSTLREIKQKIEHKKRPTCSIPCLLIALITWQLEILVTLLVGLVGVWVGLLMETWCSKNPVKSRVLSIWFLLKNKDFYVTQEQK